jgi:hypothetical protein
MVLRCEHLQAVALALQFLADQLGNLGIEIDEVLVENTHERSVRSASAAPRKGAVGSHSPEYQIGVN